MPSVKSRVPFYLAVAMGWFSPATPTLRAAADPWEERSLRIIQQTETPFPQDLLASGVSEGEVHALLMVDASGAPGTKTVSRAMSRLALRIPIYLGSSFTSSNPTEFELIRPGEEESMQ